MAGESKDLPRWARDLSRLSECPRCRGLLLAEHFMDLADDTGQIDFTALRCAICGEVIDPVILRNREDAPPDLLFGPRQRKFPQQALANEAIGTGAAREEDDRKADREENQSGHERESKPRRESGNGS